MTFWLVVMLLGIISVVLMAYGTLREQRSVQGHDARVYRDQLEEIEHDLARGTIHATQAEALRTEVERRLLGTRQEEVANGAPIPKTAEMPLAHRRATIALFCTAPLFAAGLYGYLGTPGMPDFPHDGGREQASEAGTAYGHQRAQDGELIEQLYTHLRATPDDAQGWHMLARALMSRGDFAGAAEAFTTLHTLSNDPADKLDAVEATILSRPDKSITPAEEAIFRQARRADPINMKARYYVGLLMERDGMVQAALQEWTDLLYLSPKDAPWITVVTRQIHRLADENGVAVTRLGPSTEARSLRGALSLRRGSSLRGGTTASRQDNPAPDPDSDLDSEQAQTIRNMSPADRQAMILTMVQNLAARLEDNPDDPEGWQRLARSWRVLGEEEKAQAAERRLRELREKNLANDREGE